MKKLFRSVRMFIYSLMLIGSFVVVLRMSFSSWVPAPDDVAFAAFLALMYACYDQLIREEDNW